MLTLKRDIGSLVVTWQSARPKWFTQVYFVAMKTAAFNLPLKNNYQTHHYVIHKVLVFNDYSNIISLNLISSDWTYLFS
jgi:hypothetical protein